MTMHVVPGGTVFILGQVLIVESHLRIQPVQAFSVAHIVALHVRQHGVLR